MQNSFSEPPVRVATRSPSPAPPAPPLPQSSYLDVAKNLIAPFRYGAKPPREASVSRKTDAFYYSNLRGPARSQSTNLRLGVKVNALDISEDRTCAILAGHRILRIVRIENVVEGSACYEEFDLRATAIDHAHAGKSSLSLTREERGLVESRQRETQGIEDVAWSSKIYSSHIATAGSNGKVLLWDLNRPEVELARLHEHQRQVHKVVFNRTDVALLLSGSQDATVRLWDLRQLRKDVMVCHSRSKILTQADGVRDITWSPTDPMIFALGTEGGIVQRWDIRQTAKPQLKIAAHDKPCTSIAWHFDGKHLVSGGKDRRAKIWDFGSNNKRQRAKYYIRTPREIRSVSWRPPCNISDVPNVEVWQCAQLATSYDDHPAVHIWDWRREHMPHREIYFGNSESGPADMLWHSKDLLWAVGHGKELGDFAQIDVQFVPKQLEKRNLQTLASSTTDEVVLFAQPRLIPREFSPLDSRKVDAHDFERYPSLTSNRQSPMSRSPGDDSIDDNFLSAKLRQMTPIASSSMTLNKSHGNSGVPELAAKPDSLKTHYLKFDQILRQFDNPPPTQSSKTGLLPGSPSSQILTYLAQKYKPITIQVVASSLQQSDLTKTFEQNAQYSQTASIYREAQTWRIFGSMLVSDLMKRANENRLRRCSQAQAELKNANLRKTSDVDRPITLPSHSLEVSASRPNNGSSSGSAALRIQENSSNAPTPLAKPLDNVRIFTGSDHNLPPALKIEDDLQLPASFTPSQPGNIQRNRTTNRLQNASKALSPSAGTQWYEPVADREERLAKVSQWRAMPKTPLNPDTFIKQTLHEDNHRLERKDSVDSLAMFSGSLGSQNALSKSNSFISQGSDAVSFRQAESRHSIPPSQEGASSDHLSLSPELQMRGSTATSSVLLDEGLYSSETSDSKGISSVEPISMSEREPVVRDPEPLGAAISFESTAYNSSQSSQLGSFPKIADSRESSFNPLIQEVTVFADDNRTTKEMAFTLDKSQNANPNAEILDVHQFSDIPFIPEDFYISDPEASLEEMESLASTKALRYLLRWYATHHNSQMASQLLLSWRILLPSRESIPTNDPRFFDYIVSGSGDLDTFINETIHNHLQTLDISPHWVESILSTYHDQLMTLNLLNPATALRRLACPAFPAVYEQALKDIELGTLCKGCKKPINNPRSKLRCENCCQRQGPCAICWLERSPFEFSIPKKAPQTKLPKRTPNTSSPLMPSATPATASLATTLWTSCLLCGHSAHAACISTWFADFQSDGACPTPGCLCDCVRGRRRDMRLALLASREKARKTAATSRSKPLLSSEGADGSLVRRDHWDIVESVAVGRARSALVNSGGGGRGEWKAGKRVRLVVPDEDSEGSGPRG